MSTVRWGIVGAGSIAGSVAGDFQFVPGASLVGIASRSQHKADVFAAHHGIPAAYGSYREMISDPEIDAVYIATPHPQHRDVALAAIAAGKAVMVEKAFAATLDGARQIVDAAQARGVFAMEAMWTRFLPSTDIVRQLLANGELGDVETLFADHGQWFAEDPHFRLFDPAQAGGAMLDLGVYPVSFSHFVFGTPGRIQAAGTKAFTGVDRQISAVLSDYPDHATGQSLVNTTLASKTPTVALISGTEARIEIPGAFYAPQRIKLIGRGGSFVESAPPQITGHMGLCYEAAHFATVITEGRLESDLLPWVETLAVMETMDELRRRSRKRRRGSRPRTASRADR